MFTAATIEQQEVLLAVPGQIHSGCRVPRRCRRLQMGEDRVNRGFLHSAGVTQSEERTEQPVRALAVERRWYVRRPLRNGRGLLLQGRWRPRSAIPRGVG